MTSKLVFSHYTKTFRLLSKRKLSPRRKKHTSIKSKNFRARRHLNSARSHQGQLWITIARKMKISKAATVIYSRSVCMYIDTYIQNVQHQPDPKKEDLWQAKKSHPKRAWERNAVSRGGIMRVFLSFAWGRSLGRDRNDLSSAGTIYIYARESY